MTHKLIKLGYLLLVLVILNRSQLVLETAFEGMGG